MVPSIPWGTPTGKNCGRPDRLKTARVPAGVTNGGRNRKWGYGGGSRLGFKLKVGSHRDNAGLDREDYERPCRKERGKRTLTGGP